MSEAIQNAEPFEPPAKRMKTVPSEVTIEKLPRDVLVRVVKYVRVGQWPSLERVSRAFRDAVYESWRKLRRINLDENFVFIGESSDATNQALEKLIRRAVNVADIGGFSPNDDDSIGLLARFEKLERIDFGGQGLPLEVFERFLKKSASRKSLKKIDAEGAVEQETEPEERPLYEAFREQNGLEPLRLERFCFENHSKLHFSWAFLNAVDVSRLTSFNVLDTHVSQSLMASFLNRAISLQRLKFSFDCYYDEQPWKGAQLHAKEPGPTELLLQLNKKVIEAVGNAKNLVSLTMNVVEGVREDCGCRNFSAEMEETFKKLGRCGSLKELSLFLYYTYPYAEQATKSIATALPKLASLEILVDEFDDATGERVLKAQKSLADFKLTVSDETSTNFVQLVMANAPHLQVMHLDSIDGDIPKEQLLQITAFKQLKELRVRTAPPDPGHGCSVDDEVLVAWAEAFGPKLESLEISPCSKVTDEGLSALVTKTPRLRKLYIRNSNITDSSLKEMATGCPDIYELNLSECPNITLKGLQAVVDGCVNLKYLYTRGSPWSADKLKVEKYRKIAFL